MNDQPWLKQDPIMFVNQISVDVALLYQESR
jgi:hypothetical protein